MEGLNSATWRKSSYSGGNGGGCVEAGVADTTGVVLVRDTTNRTGAILTVTANA
jgi:Domain of unknown function (DUF397)